MKQLKKVALLCMTVAIMMVLAGPIGAEDSGKINLNKATVEELAQLQRIGTKYAERIVKHREENGPFKTTEDIIKVPGIGPKTFELNKDRLAVE
ncbi:MAG: helix-hairpin-helix domain-containing protein [Desulfobacteraceae bacterium]|nr:helix-hairpin-helix domain-containing protein [Desulfobacteraceae bacterium]